MNPADLDYLYNFAQQINTRIHYSNLRSAHEDLLGYTKPPDIYLDTSLLDKPRQHKCILAEEIGHNLFPPRPGHVAYHHAGLIDVNHYNRSNLKAIVAQDERKALAWAAAVLMPNVEFWDAVSNGVNTISDLAEYFEVEEKIVLQKIGYIRVQAINKGIKLKWRDIIRRVK